MGMQIFGKQRIDHDQQAGCADHKKQAEPGDLGRPRGLTLCIQVFGNADTGAELQKDHPHCQERMRRRENRHIQSIGIVPPVVEGRGSQHRDGAPNTKKGTEWAIEDPPDPNLRSAGGLPALY